MREHLGFLVSIVAAFGSLFTIFPPEKCDEAKEVERLCSHFATRSDGDMIARDFAAVGSAIDTAMRSLHG